MSIDANDAAAGNQRHGPGRPGVYRLVGLPLKYRIKVQRMRLSLMKAKLVGRPRMRVRPA